MSSQASSSPRRVPFAGALLAVALGAALAGCVVAPARPVYADGPVVAVAPPPPQGEIVGVAPVAGQIWIGGYWGWNGGRHVWVPGRWDAPRPGYGWHPHAWVREGGGWRQQPGYWRRR